MKKVLVIGPGGAGKSTFSKRLGLILNIEVTHLDVLYWKPGWVETAKPVWKNIVAELVQQDTWIIDGNYSGTLDIRVEACDTVIFLDVARLVCIWRVLKRMMTYRSGGRPDMAEGCHERFNLEFLRWVWNYRKRTGPKVLKLLNESSPAKRVILLRTEAEIESFLANVAAKHSKPFETTVR
jgi:adenylate kinase family enzyme